MVTHELNEAIYVADRVIGLSRFHTQGEQGAAIVYDRPGKGDDLVIEVGKDEVSYAHTVDSPTEVLTGQNSNGVMVALRISDAAGVQTLIQLQAS